ncbi:HI1506-related protein [Yersinia pseudotuberculosis]|uniref:HI1506-related protein n=1 Tax=Yersinia pseudotuberculosis TaxID=633 RepID=UPI0038B66D4F
MPIQITAKRDGFRRCGVAHSDKTQTYADSHFSPKVLAELKAEPMLVVSHVPDSQQGNTEQSQELTDAKARFQELFTRNQALDASVFRLADDADALKSSLGTANGTIAEQQLEIDVLKAQIANLTPAPDTASKESEGAKTTKTTK